MALHGGGHGGGLYVARRLIVGPRVPVARFGRLGDELAEFQLTLSRDDVDVDTGRGANVPDGLDGAAAVARSDGAAHAALERALATW